MNATEDLGFEFSAPVAGIEDAVVVAKVPLMRWDFEMLWAKQHCHCCSGVVTWGLQLVQWVFGFQGWPRRCCRCSRLLVMPLQEWQ